MTTYKEERNKYIGDLGKMPIESIALIIIVAIFAILIVLFAIVNALKMGATSRENAKEYVSELTTQVAETINTDQNDMKNMLSGISETIGLLYSDGIDETSTKEYLEKYLNASNNSSQFDYLVLINTTKENIEVGQIPSSLEGKFNEDLEVVKQANDSSTPIAYILDDNILFASSVYDSNHNFIGTLVSGANGEDLKRLINVQIYREEDNFCLINNEGKVLLASDAGRLKMLEENADSLSEEMTIFENDIKQRNDGVLYITFPDGKEYLLAYQPIEGEDWIILILLPSNVFSEVYESFVNSAFICTIAAILIFIILVSLLVISYRKARKKLEEIAFTDELTEGINNNEFELRYAQLRRKADPLNYSIVILDVRDFKLINEAEGFAYGDSVLKRIYRAIKDCLNENEYEFVARRETDHFFVCLKEHTAEDIQKRIDEITANVNKDNIENKREYKIEFEQGACIIYDKNIDVATLQERARIARRFCDKQNLNKCAIYTDEIRNRVFEDKKLDKLAEESMKNHDFLVYYQPKVSMSTGKIKGAEALVRWNHPEKGLISPALFIPVLEDSGNISKLDKYVYEDVCIWLANRQKSNKPMFPISINLSRNHFWKDNFLKEYVDIADKYGVNHDYIEFEITETAFMGEEKHKKIKDGIRQMHENGFRCSVDDFGVGYSSLSLVHEMDVDILKFDRSFFLDLEDEKSQKLVRSLINMANELQLGIIIEGIETQDQIDFLKHEKCDVIQGYFYSKPLPEKEFDKWVDENLSK